MKRFALVALPLCAALLFGGAYAREGGEVAHSAVKGQCKKDAKGKCLKPTVKPKAKKKHQPIAKVPPRIPKAYTPPPRADARFLAIVDAYKQCMYGEGDVIERALALNLLERESVMLGGTPEKLGNEVCLSDALGLKRYETLAEIESAGGRGELVEVFPRAGLSIADDLPAARRFARPWARDYLHSLARDLEAYADKEGIVNLTPFKIASMVRSYSDQRRQWNSPASCRTEICSTHTTGSAVDISNNFFHMNKKERAWLRERLLEDRRKGKIVMIEERFPPHFHIFVLPTDFVPGKQAQE
ncbi:MAG: hypothetical protein A3C93_04665 [Candidatus Lloydbacteria bacterium RIFCSPHIGHO2_02_FULL_54_17]|uniref:Peptidase M15B domain-containing protein n=1 Tax=Candidatus Lloydbacteria bacterium RIFCSPHIGHO2_02_FULL_54_17 TaxID=1798664 RepID=A0A1G2DFL9_9BACT|nr:MAG: hypothetical protein A2762_01575 [Candidatus Lloydbacteria bacterium RIFCSPHIGHO2_01_FULL_54_11]OGZ12444.1 MAG: hypothetical protein A3C93_04665 [Candidatus Lloydbacteria bacterium RIFCSPHIGHO2_02_FULL_54_17]OGZ14703.1 MAG: hypothetical protein A2948_04345 [Candidatus Lloydbacteria bacterium RIFCSPLOWO2_01_FULL_54_18]OGZ16731.1 MAG: hypothetical protein A3H76_02250 [Candidatus Lloydbacteria bacterium RIFCSPLOWO2_02_FULL_54_12]